MNAPQNTNDPVPAAAPAKTVQARKRLIGQNRWPLVAVALLVLVAFSMQHRLLRLIDKEILRITEKINKSRRGISIADLQRVLLNGVPLTKSPMGGVFLRSRKVATGEERSSSTWAALLSDKQVGTISGIPDPKNISSLITALSLLNATGFQSEEARLLRFAVQYSGEARFLDNEIGTWIDIAYTKAAKAHFDLGQYFLGLAQVEGGLQRARARRVPNLTGKTTFTESVSPLLVIDAFFPKTPEQIAYGMNLSTLARLVIDANYGDIRQTEKASGVLNPLLQYAAGVDEFQKNNFEVATKYFLVAADIAPNVTASDLGKFMVVRTRFWQLSSEIEKVRAVAGQTEDLESKLDNDLKFRDSDERKLYQIVSIAARAFVAELVRSGVVRPYWSGNVRTTQGKKNRNQKALLQHACNSARRDIALYIRGIHTAKWKEEAGDYWQAIGGLCENPS